MDLKVAAETRANQRFTWIGFLILVFRQTMKMVRSMFKPMNFFLGGSKNFINPHSVHVPPAPIFNVSGHCPNNPTWELMVKHGCKQATNRYPPQPARISMGFNGGLGSVA